MSSYVLTSVLTTAILSIDPDAGPKFMFGPTPFRNWNGTWRFRRGLGGGFVFWMESSFFPRTLDQGRASDMD